VAAVLPNSLSLGLVDGVDVRRWEDPSGARLILGLRGKDVEDLLPSFASPTGASLVGVKPLDGEIAVADVVDQDGETLTRMAIELEERRFLASSEEGWHGPASTVALGVAVTLHESDEAFAESPASLLSSENKGSDPPQHYVERGLKWPPRMGSESFISYGLFATPDAHARLHGTVISSERRVVLQTGQEVIISAVQTVGFTANVCTPADDLAWQPASGNVLGGSVFMVGSIPALTPDIAKAPKANRPRWLRRHH
jgi:hypothetical protein